MGTRAQLTQELKDDLHRIEKVSKMAIRAIGKDGSGAAHYSAFIVSDDNAPLPSVENDVLFTIKVKEEGNLEVRGCSQELLMRSETRPCSSQNIMKIDWFNHKNVGKITNKKIIDEEMKGCSPQINLSYTWTSIGDVYAVIIFAKFGTSQNIASFQAVKRSATVTVEFLLTAVKSTLKMMLLLAGLKFYYNVYNLHLLVTPINVPQLMCGGTPEPSSLHKLINISVVRLRMCGNSKSGIRFVEFLKSANNEVLLISENMHEEGYTAAIKDPFGVLIFWFIQKQSSPVLEIYVSDEKIGEFNSSCDFIVPSGKRMMHLTQLPGCHKFDILDSTQYNRVSLASLYSEDDFYTMTLEILPNLCLVSKALIIACAHKYLFNYYLFNQQLFPTLSKCIYRPR